MRKDAARGPVDDIIYTAFATEQAVYGVLLVSGIITAYGSHDASAVTVLITVVATVLVFWMAHVYAGTLTRFGTRASGTPGLKEALRRSVHHSWGMLGSAFVPSFVLLLGALGVIREDVSLWIALWVGVGVLAVLGYAALAHRRASPLARLCGAAGTAFLGILMVILKASVH